MSRKYMWMVERYDANGTIESHTSSAELANLSQHFKDLSNARVKLCLCMTEKQDDAKRVDTFYAYAPLKGQRPKLPREFVDTFGEATGCMVPFEYAVHIESVFALYHPECISGEKWVGNTDCLTLAQWNARYPYLKDLKSLRLDAQAYTIDGHKIDPTQMRAIIMSVADAAKYDRAMTKRSSAFKVLR